MYLLHVNINNNNILGNIAIFSKKNNGKKWQCWKFQKSRSGEMAQQIKVLAVQA